MQMVPHTTESGRMTSNMDSELRDGQMVPSTRVITMKERRMELENLLLLMGLSTKEHLL